MIITGDNEIKIELEEACTMYVVCESFGILIIKINKINN
jgi:hypothetical protein